MGRGSPGGTCTTLYVGDAEGQDVTNIAIAPPAVATGVCTPAPGGATHYTRTINPAITSAGTDSALIDTAPPAASPLRSLSAGVGRRERRRKDGEHRQRVSDGGTVAAFTGTVTEEDLQLARRDQPAAKARRRGWSRGAWSACRDRDGQHHTGRHAQTVARPAWRRPTRSYVDRQRQRARLGLGRRKP